MIRRRSWIPLLALVLLCRSMPCGADDTSRQVLFDEGRKLDLRISMQFEPAMRDNVLRWIEFISAALATVYGHWPREQWQVSVAPVSAAADDPIPWAQVHRGDPDRVEFFTLGNASENQLRHAWTGYHEFAHLLIPYRGWGDAWFSEGLASYYQNLLQARVDVLSEQQMWQKIVDGFRRGRADSSYDGKTLQAVSDDMRSKGGFMRVYWSGAWYFLSADIQLRSRSGGRHNLDRALQQLNACCADQSMSVAAIVSKLDELNKVTLFQTLYNQAIASRRMPAYEPLFASLGIRLDDGRARLLPDGPGANLRRQIVAGDNL